MKKILCFLLVVLLSAGSVPAMGETKEELKLYAKSAVLMDADSGRILYEREGNNVMPMASTTKIMTCIVALENGNLQDSVTVSAHAAAQPKVHLGMREGQQFKLGDLLYSLMLESHNDTAVAIAEHIGGSVEGFTAMMNQKAKDIGCFDTFFVTPNGLDAKVQGENGETKIHSTTAADLARIMRYCIRQSEKRDAFLEITRTPAYSFQDIEGGRQYSCNNHNAFLSMMDGALTGKTGFTNGAGYCYVGALERDGKCFVVALLACGWPNHKSWKWHDTRMMMEYGLANYEYREFTVPTEVTKLTSIPVSGGKTDRIGEECTVPVTLVSDVFGLLMQEGEEVEIRQKMGKTPEAPVKRDEEVGTVSYFVNGQMWKQDRLVTAGNIEKIDYGWCFEKVMKIFLFFY